MTLALLDITLAYRRSGLCVLPAIAAEKRPAVPSWKPYRKRLPTEAELRAWFGAHTAVCIVAGTVSGHLEVVDFDRGGLLYGPWTDLVLGEAPGLLERLVMERSPSGGCHVVYRCETAVPGNLKLAQRLIDGRSATLIETRGEGGLFLCDPTPGYDLQQGLLTDLPVLSAAEHTVLIEAARALNEVAVRPQPARAPSEAGGRPGDKFNQRGDLRAVLQNHGWTLVRPGENEHWRRPGKPRGWSATLKGRVFYVFSTNAAPFEREKAYAPFAVYALLEHGGDFEAAARALRQEGYGVEAPPQDDVDLSGILPAEDPGEVDDEVRHDDPGAMPTGLLTVPGFVAEVMDYSLRTAPYPQPALAFAAALALQAFLAGRKVRDATDIRTNLYILALANSGSGKDHPRKVNQRILIEAGLHDVFGETFASGEGVEDRLFTTPSVLFQTDELDGLVLAIAKGKDPRWEGIMSVLLKFYTSANTLYPMRVKAGQSPGVIDQPSLCLLGTAIPKHYYEAMSVRMLTNGFLARMLVLEAGPRGRGQDFKSEPPPARLVETARWWADFTPGEHCGNLKAWHPSPALVEATPEAEAVLRGLRRQADSLYEKAEKAEDLAATAIWARACEKARKLALLYACSENPPYPKVTEPGAKWASALMLYLTHQTLWRAGRHVAETEFHARCKRMLEALSQWTARRGDEWMPYWRLSRLLPWTKREIEDVREALLDQWRIEYHEETTGGRIRKLYRLRQ